MATGLPPMRAWPVSPDLAAHLGVEGRAVEDEEHPLLRADDLEHRGVGALRGVERVAREEGRRMRVVRRALGGRHDDLLLLRGAPALPLLLHERLEARRVDRDAALGGDHLGQVEGESVGVVELEDDRARERTGRRGLVEAPQPALERPAEALLLGLDDAPDRGLLAPELGEHPAERLDDGIDELLEEAGAEPEVAPVEGRAAQDPPDDVVAALVAGKDAVGDGAADAAGVVGQDPEGDVGLLLRA